MSEHQLGAARIIVCSTRAAAGEYQDLTGPILVDWARAKGFDSDDAVVVADGAPVGAAVADALASGHRLIVTTGGTGVSRTDLTPEYTRPFLTTLIPGIVEAIRAKGASKVATAWLSRGEAGLAKIPHPTDETDIAMALVVNLPGSQGGVKDGMAVLDDLAIHVVEQLAGGDHGNH